MEHRLLAIDQASKTIGWSIFVDGKLIEHGKKDFTNPNVIKRITELRDWVYITMTTNNINEVILEDIQMQNGNVSTYKILAYVLGTLEVLMVDKNMKYRILAPSSWRSTLNIKGRARAEQKANTKKYVLDTFGLEVSEDTADAIAIGQAAVVTTKINWA